MNAKSMYATITRRVAVGNAFDSKFKGRIWLRSQMQSSKTQVKLILPEIMETDDKLITFVEDFIRHDQAFAEIIHQ